MSDPIDRKKWEARADALGIPHRTNWRDETVMEKVTEAEAAKAGAGESKEEAAASPPPNAVAAVASAAEAQTLDGASGADESNADGAPSPLPPAKAAVTSTAAAQLKAAPATPSITDLAKESDVTVEEQLTIGETVLTIRVRGPKKGRYRAGRHFTRDVTEIPVDELTDGELDALQADPKLTVKVPDETPPS
ncbi:hypothetical protein J4E08_10065 [Sagittula sp. NFXS13]|uniref:hypothetical protein n=1 Tax=Sagittula sp. NFXS13 TaxID=2819095 RepID=UPI0032DE8629